MSRTSLVFSAVLAAIGTQWNRFWSWSAQHSGPADWALVLVGAFGVVAAMRTLRAGQDQATAATNAADAAKKSADAVIHVERAYVDISHAQPGLVLGNDIRFSLGVKNFGKTPAYITPLHTFLQLGEKDADLPDAPMYGRPPSEQPHVFLMPSDTVNVAVIQPALPPQEMQRIGNGERVLWLLAYQDYIERFQVRHRAGYCRRYIPAPLPGSLNNLVFVAKPGYNYDIEIDERGNPAG